MLILLKSVYEFLCDIKQAAHATNLVRSGKAKQAQKLYR